ncbi:hypothetical protein [Paraglaciecola marina]|uniref:hypothetical protein n=1 Tax=Paraglaciecola marina TaxID=2500157 RepID=UPI00105E835F|nr:hypothetical protein [Paraglaciecola marina]
MVSISNTNEQAATTKDSLSKNNLKQAVVVIHGMGEQRPMDTIREFVNHVFKQDPNLKDPHFWNKPSSVSESFEQRRLTTNKPTLSSGKESVYRTDFYEYYWAHHTVNTKWEHFVGWFLTLLVCRPRKYDDHPNTLKPLWFALWGLIILAGMSLVGWGALVNHIDDTCKEVGQSVLIVIITIGEILALCGLNWLKSKFTKYFGDVARYVRANPANINIRQAIRKGGIELVERIHQSGDYDRIVIVGHSLGSIVAYDILNHLWARHNKFKYTKGNRSFTSPLSKASIELLEELQEMTKVLGTSSFNQDAYRAKQHKLFCELRDNDKANNWLVSDFITLGSPLTYADILLFDDNLQFTKRKLDREYPTSPPVPEAGNWFYKVGSRKYLHHGAVFAPVKWTNIFMPHKNFLKGDLISGPVGKNFSYVDIEVDTLSMTPPSNLTSTPIKELELDYKKVKNSFTHTKYWQSSEISDEHLVELRKALALF